MPIPNDSANNMFEISYFGIQDPGWGTGPASNAAFFFTPMGALQLPYCDAARVPSVPSNGMTYVSSNTGAPKFARNGVWIEFLTGWPLYAPDGNSAFPSYSFANAQTSGIWATSGNLIIQANTPAQNVTVNSVLQIKKTVAFSVNVFTPNIANCYIDTANSIWIINKTGNVGSPTFVTLPNTSDTLVYTIKDGKGDSSINSITISSANGNVTIDGTSSVTIRQNYGSVMLVFNGTQWNVI